MEAKTQNTVAIIAGLVATTAVGAALIPLMKTLLINSIRDAHQRGMPVSNISIYGYEFLWVTVSALVGGYIACWIAVERKVYHSLLTGVFSFVILVFGSTVATKTAVASVLLALSFIPLTLMGGIIRQIIENKKMDME